MQEFSETALEDKQEAIVVSIVGLFFSDIRHCAIFSKFFPRVNVSDIAGASA